MTTFSRRGFVAAAALGAINLSTLRQAGAQGKGVTLVVPTAAGGTTDMTARLLAEPLGRILLSPVAVENRGGDNGIIGGQLVARAPADGATLLIQYSGYQSIAPLIQPVAGFDPGKDLVPVARLIDAPQLMVVRSDFPASTFGEFLKYVKAHPGKVTYASSGNGSLQHVTTEMLKDLTGTFMTHIPYRGTGPALADLLAGTVDFTITTPPPLLPHVRSGRLKALMVTGRTRLQALPQVPAATELGVPLVASSWFAVYGPRGLPTEVQARLASAIRQVVNSEPFRRRAEDLGARAQFLDGSSLDKLARDERAMWARIVKLAHIKAD
ncbi:MAG: tripartite tricarboxylate transporter substrate binding protein [Ramlibacter sp.]|nr:tripartite tricarboxylate transporter substrate binding protein [Ramlibacter sp.]